MRLNLGVLVGSVLTGRTPARDLREQVEELARSEEGVILDFSGVEALSPSFGDEFFAKIDAELLDSGAVRYEGIDPLLLPIVEFFTSAIRRPADPHTGNGDAFSSPLTSTTRDK